jgi:ribosomal protein L11 methylase PrmA
MSDQDQIGASFRDPSGFIFRRQGILYRQVNQAYAEPYARLMESGLYEKLVKAGLLVSHRESAAEPAQPLTAFKVLEPQQIPFISYPYEWPFSLLKDAALATLSIQKRSLKAGMSLKDASAYNIQFLNGRPALIDTLSFEPYVEGQPWVAYRQFCQHFLAPLALMAYTDVRLGQLLRVYIDGIPLDLASRLLPVRTRLNPGLLAHIHLHAGAQRRYADEAPKSPISASARMSREALLGLVDSLQSNVKMLDGKPGGTEWGDYYNMTNYSGAAFEHKKELIASWLARVSPGSVWDLGANDGTFSRLASAQGIPTLAWDIDPTAVEMNYRKLRKDKEKDLLPLVLDLTNPSPALGWHHRERDSFMDRGPAGMVFALALIHHLAISNNVPLRQLAQFFRQAGNWLVIEFVPKTDSQVRKLLQTRLDIFPAYTAAGFEEAFSEHFTILERAQVRESERLLYLMECR